MKKLLENQQVLRQNGILKDSTSNKLQQFADAQKAKVKQGVGLLAVPEMKSQGNEGMNKLGAALATKAMEPKMVTDNLEGIQVTNNGQLQFDQNSIGQLGQDALKDKDNQEFLKQLQMFNSRA